MIKKYTLKDGTLRYGTIVYLGIDPLTGKQLRKKKKGFKTYNEAALYEKRAKIAYEDKNNDFFKQRSTTKFKDVFEEWKNQYRLSVKESTYLSETRRIKNHILPQLGGTIIDKITLAQCQKAVNAWYKDYQKASLLVSLSNRIFEYSINAGYQKDNPMEHVMRPKTKNKKKYKSPSYNKAKLKSFFEIIKDEPLDTILTFRLFAYTGIRSGELLGLKWKDIDEEDQTLSVERSIGKSEKESKVTTPKTESSIRTISLDRRTLDMLKNWRNEQRERFLKLGVNTNSSEQFIFTDIYNQHYGIDRNSRLLKQIKRKYDIPPIAIHSFRHTHCSLLFEAGVSMNDVKDRLGHASIKTTMDIYAHVTEESKDRTADKFAQFMEI
ncbi:tyrosine-type recombinase/integrase [Aerococcus sp. Group 1]|uniref:tyrosine-type recombinase/integrase n=1 Tax=Aerococcus urinae (strain CCUG 59500 / ACS-120-V-Col10a) TaxID=2976812 RepID=UPI00227D5D6A|nr:site-specific integrase [Aerococcus sp. Group 1]MCY3031018.1 site-specific integrase [Aerococcus sp. Group 1]